MDDSRINSINQAEEIIKVEEASKEINFSFKSRKEKYHWLEEKLNQFRYFGLCKKDKSIVRRYLAIITELSNSQLTVLIGRKKKTGKILVKQESHHKFATVYGPQDVARLIETDKAHNCLAGPATKDILVREYKVFSHQQYEKISQISVSHIYNLRKTRQYQSHTVFWQKTKSSAPNNIGERRKPDPQGRPGFIRVDTVHQGDLEKAKGVYHINLVDEVLQWEIVACVPQISEYYLLPVLEDILRAYPFAVINFHSDNGSEYINKVVAKLLNKLLIKQTKSRPRHSNDNGLVEGKNGSVIRKWMGRNFISKNYAVLINNFYQDYFNIYLNYHRPCGFATIKVDARGKEKKVYDVYQTPYEALKSLPNAKNFLKKGISFEKLDKVAYEKSDNEFAASMQKAKVELFNKFNHKNHLPTQLLTSPISCLSID